MAHQCDSLVFFALSGVRFFVTAKGEASHSDVIIPEAIALKPLILLFCGCYYLLWLIY